MKPWLPSTTRSRVKRSWGGRGPPTGSGGVTTGWNTPIGGITTACFALQMETVTGVINAGKLAKPGIDCLTWGPADLSFDLEAHPEFPYQTTDDCVRHVLKQLEGTDVKISFEERRSRPA